ncbi:hypothetical protein ACRARG_12735 [Pseudooceanicola sp. C21-150M6]|uniref:hypothetical protein n=1 Tax=Pseudooceanicola sp. C21-150M6 TaxID=3434355 RepID=UPI003D7FBC28
MTPEEFRSLARPQIRKLARRGKLVDTAFKVFCDAVYPGCPEDQRAALRIAFFAGAQELHVLQMTAVDEGSDITDDDYLIYGQIAEEIERFHQRTLAAMEAAGRAN